MQPEILIPQLADEALALEIGETLRDRLRDRNGARRRQRAIVEPRAGDDVADEPGVGGGKARRLEIAPQSEEIILLHMRENDVLLMADAQFAEAVFVRRIGERAHLRGSGVARNAADRLQRDRDDGVAGDLVRRDIHRGESGEFGVLRLRLLERLRSRGQSLIGAAARRRRRRARAPARHRRKARDPWRRTPPPPASGSRRARSHAPKS